MEKKSFDLKNFLMKYIMYLFLVLMCVVLAIASDKFLTPTNLMTIVKQISIQSIVAIGMTMIIITGNIDLSVGSVVAFCSVIGAMMMNKGMPMILAIVIAIVAGALIGFIITGNIDLSVGSVVAFCSVIGAMMMNKGMPMILAIVIAIVAGALIGFITGGVTAKLKLHSFLVTLALMTAIRGLAQTLTNGRPVAGLPDTFGKIASASIGPVPLLVIYMIVLYAVFIYVMKYTAFGRSIYAVGGNQESARLSGINVDKVKTMVFVISGALCV